MSLTCQHVNNISLCEQQSRLRFWLYLCVGKMSTFSYLQPNLMATEELRNHLKIRFPNQDMTRLGRDELIKLFSMYAIPKARRATSNGDVDMKSVNDTNNALKVNENKRSRHQLITAPTVETVTNACKKIRLINPERIVVDKKRPCDAIPMESDDNHQPETKRKKITWP